MLFDTLLITEEDGKYIKEIKQVDADQLPDNDLLIRVSYSSVNYKDSLSASGNKGVTKKFPHVPGIDAAGVVVRSRNSAFSEGDKVLVTGFDLGMNTWGGFAEYVSVPVEWALPLPEALSMKEAMSFGTAGLTAGLSIHKLLEAGLNPEHGEVLVSGATGGVGSLATAMLSQAGFSVTAISGKAEDQFLFEVLGAKKRINRDEFIKTYNNRSLAAMAFAAGIDTVGGDILSGMLKATRYGGLVTCCGMVASAELNTSIFPFILRGIQLVGIDSVLAPLSLRRQVWEKMSAEWKPSRLADMVKEVRLSDLPEKLEDILAGKALGRFVVAL